MQRVFRPLPFLVAGSLAATLVVPEGLGDDLLRSLWGVRAGLAALLVAYAGVTLALRTGRFRLARYVLLTAWSLYPASLLALHDPGLPWVFTLTIWTITVAMLGLVVVGIVAIEHPRRVIGWTGLVSVATGTAGAWVGLTDPTIGAQVVVTILGVCGAIVAAMALGARSLVGHLEEALDEAEQLRSQTEEALLAAQASDVAKSRFLANMSHELRTPLTAIIGYSEMCLDDVDEGEPMADDLGRIHTAGHHLLGIVDAVLDLSRVEAGKVEVTPELVDLPALLTSAADAVRPLAEQKQLELTTEAEPASAFRSDTGLLRQVLVNLLANSVRYTHSGSVRLLARSTDDEVVFTVADTGVGIADDQLQRLFRPFERGTDDHAVRAGGIGLGLSITARLCEALGASIAVESTVGRGTTVTVRAPSLPAPTPGSPPAR
jgi:signal transduction histidine kinase